MQPNNDVISKHKGEKPISAKAVGMTVTYAFKNGDTFKIHANHPIRDNNPGNVISSPIAKVNGSIGFDCNFAIFPTPQDGWNALCALLKKKYIDSSLDDTIQAYAPPKENNTAHYKAKMSKITGLTGDTLLSTLSDVQFKKVMATIADLEGWKGESYAN